jgi:hypothetical protein
LTVSKTYPAAGITAVHIEFPAGDLYLSGSKDSEVSVTMTARCRASESRCAERARRIRLLSETRENTLFFKLEKLPKFNHPWLHVGLQVRIPRGLAAAVEMGAGDLDIRGLDRDVKVHMGAGDVDIHAPERFVGSVDVHVGIGDAAMSRGGNRLDGSGWLSKRLRWHEGRGPARVEVDLGVGDVGVALD